MKTEWHEEQKKHSVKKQISFARQYMKTNFKEITERFRLSIPWQAVWDGIKSICIFILINCKKRDALSTFTSFYTVDKDISNWTFHIWSNKRLLKLSTTPLYRWKHRPWKFLYTPARSIHFYGLPLQESAMNLGSNLKSNEISFKNLKT